MSGGTDIIREFLVALGFKVDDKGLRDFVGGVGGATKAVAKLAAAVEATAGVVAYGVARFAENLEQLYFSSRRVGSSATNIKAFDLAAQNFGASAQEAQGSVEGLAAALRDNPGNVGLLHGLGVHLHKAKDGTYDAVDALMQLSKVFSSGAFAGPQNYYAAKQFADQLGISELTLLAMRQPGFAQAFASARKSANNNGFDKAADDAHAFMSQLRDLGMVLEAFGAKVVDALQKKLGMNLKQLKEWVEKNGPRIAAVLIYDVDRLLDAAEWLRKKVVELIVWFREANKETDGWAGKLLGLLAIMRATGATGIVAGVLNLAAAFVRLAAGIGAADTAAGAGRLAALLGRLGIVGAAVGAYEVHKLYVKQEAENSSWRKAHPGQQRITPEARGFLQWINDHLMSRTTQARTMLAHPYGWDSAHVAGIMANLQTEDPGLDPWKVGDHGKAFGIAQWHKPFWDLYKKWSGGQDIHASTLSQQIAFLNWDLASGPDRGIGDVMRRQTTAANVAKVMSLLYERPAAGAVAADQRAARAVHIEQKTDIHITGVSGTAAGKEAARQQRHVNADMARNFAGAH